MKIQTLLSLLILTVSCASMKEEIKGFSGSERTKALSLIEGKTPAEAKVLLGIPAAEGLCTQGCGYNPKGIYKMVYLNKTLPRYSYALTMTNKSHLECFIIDFRYNEESKQHVFDGTGVMDQTSCAQDTGPIAMVRNMK